MSQILETNTPSDTATGAEQFPMHPVALSVGSSRELSAPVKEAPVALVTLTMAFAEAWQHLQGTLEARLTTLDDATTAVLDDTLEDSLRQQAEHEARKLAESIGVFGFVQGAQLAREVERLFAVRPSSDSVQALRLAEVVVLLRSQLEQAPAFPQSSRPESLRVPFVLIVDENPEWAEQVTLAALTQGLRVNVVPD
jgi:hypothetical protein